LIYSKFSLYDLFFIVTLNSTFPGPRVYTFLKSKFFVLFISFFYILLIVKSFFEKFSTNFNSTKVTSVLLSYKNFFLLKLNLFFNLLLVMLYRNVLYFCDIFSLYALSVLLFSFFFKFLRLSYLLWLDTLIIDFLQKKSFHNFIKSYILISPDFIENFIFKFLSNPITIRVSSIYRQFSYKESSSTYSFFILFYFIFILVLVFLLINNLVYKL
jgi:hypothetical protein